MAAKLTSPPRNPWKKHAVYLISTTSPNTIPSRDVKPATEWGNGLFVTVLNVCDRSYKPWKVTQQRFRCLTTTPENNYVNMSKSIPSLLNLSKSMPLFCNNSID
ncbi:hypothetical protein NC652_039296 [Populus alba x Populus x berolinensis]|nr:hypothetical protein NC652_039296 [Populus alba x Populus x berolinensis]